LFQQETTITEPLKNTVSISDTPYCSCTGRCVRRAFLFGTNEFSGKPVEHRRQWIVDRLNHLADAFFIEICAHQSTRLFEVYYINEDDCGKGKEGKLYDPKILFDGLK